MKTTKLLFTLLALLGMTQAAAQEYEYVPFVREGVKWVYRIYNDGGFYPTDPSVPEGRTYMKLEFKGDTTINGKIYMAIHIDGYVGVLVIDSYTGEKLSMIPVLRPIRTMVPTVSM